MVYTTRNRCPGVVARIRVLVYAAYAAIMSLRRRIIHVRKGKKI